MPDVPRSARRLFDGQLFGGLPREVAILSSVSLTVALGYGIVAPSIPAFARQFGVSAATAASVVSAFALMRVAGALPAGWLVDRFGERRTMAAGIAIVAVSSVLAGFSGSFVQLIVLRGIGGVGSAMFGVSGQTLLLSSVSSDQRGRASGLYTGGFLLGSISGPALGGLVAAWSLRAPFFIYGAMLTVPAGIALAVLRDRQRVPREPKGAALPGLTSEVCEEGRQRLPGARRRTGETHPREPKGAALPGLTSEVCEEGRQRLPGARRRTGETHPREPKGAVLPGLTSEVCEEGRQRLPGARRRTGETLSRALRDRAYQAAAAANLADGFAVIGVRSAIVPLFVKEVLHRPPTWTGIGFGVVAALNAAMLLPAGRVADTLGRRPVIVAGCLGSAAGMVTLAFSPGLRGFIIAMAVLGISSGLLDVAPSAMIGDLLGKLTGRPRDGGRAETGGGVVASYQMAGDVGAVTGPIAVGFLVDSVSYAAAFLLAAGVLVAAACTGLAARETRTAASSDLYPARPESHQDALPPRK